MRHFFDDTLLPGATTHILNETESKHICKVLRMSEGDRIAIVNGKGNEFETEISDAHPKKCKVKILETITEDAPEFDIHIAIAPTKMNERMEWFIEKATEIGVTSITFLATKNAERKVIKLDRFEKVAISAMKQSRRLYLPVLTDLTDIQSFISNHPNGLIAECYDEPKALISSDWKRHNCAILIGPEGDFTLEEVEFARKNGYKSISLGKNRLRTETAGLVACMQAIMQLG